MTSDTTTRILIVDADNEDQTLVQPLLHRAHMVAVPAAGAKEAAKILQTQPPPAAIVLDMELPRCQRDRIS